MSSTGSYSVYVDLKLNTKDFDSGIKSAQSSLNNFGNAGNNTADKFSAKWAAVFGAIGGLAASAFNKALNTLTSGIENGIKRIDTLKNSEVVFKAMGYSAKDAADTMKTLDKYLDGLPTSMTNAVSGVQLLSASFGGIKKGTQVFQDMNDAGLAFGATSDMIQNAIVQLSQTSLDGPLDAQTWNSLRNSGFSPVFAALAKESNMTVGQLKADFGGNGTRTVGDFLDALHRLALEGGGDMEALRSLARKNTEGIGTSLENLQNRIGKAWANIMDTIGRDTISGVINNISYAIVNFSKKLSDAIVWIKDNQEALRLWGSIVAGVGVALSGAMIAQKVSDMARAIQVYQGAMLATTGTMGSWSGALGSLPAPISGVANALSKVGGSLKGVFAVIKSNPVVAIIGLIVGALTIFFTKTETGQKLLQKIMGTISGLFGKLSPLIEGVMTAFEPLLNMVMEGFSHVAEAFAPIMDVVVDMMNQVMKSLAPLLPVIIDLVKVIGQALAPVGAIIAALVGALVPVLAVIIRVISEIIATVLNIALPAVKVIADAITLAVKAIVAVISTIVGTVRQVFDWVWNIIKGVIDKIGGGFNNMVNGVKSIFQGIADTVSGVFGVISGVVRGVINGVIGGINGVIDTINSIKVPDWVPSIGGASANISHISYMASGGIVEARSGGTPVILGEGGQNEWVVPESKMASLIDKLGAGVGTKVVQNNTINTPVDLQIMNQRLGNAVRRAV